MRGSKEAKGSKIGKVLSYDEAVADVMAWSGLGGEIVRVALGMAYLHGNKAGYREAHDAGQQAMDRVLDRMDKKGGSK